MNKKYNRLRIVLAEKEKSNRWLAEQLSVNDNTVSRWINNLQQPSVQTLYEVAQILEVDICDLLVRENENK